MGGSLFGSAPKANFSTQSTILPQQVSLLNTLQDVLQQGTQPAGVAQYPGPFAAPLNPLQLTSLAGIENIASGAGTPQKTPQQSSAIDQGFNALTSALGFQAPQIDATQAFQRGVVEPLTDDFTSRILPAISGQYAGSAGGAFSSGRQQASQQAGQTLERTLVEQGSKFAYDAAAANQQAALAANQQRLAGLGAVPAITGLPTALDAERLRQLTGTLGAGAVPYTAAQTEVTGQYGEFVRQQQQIQQLIADLIAAATGTTQTTIGVGSGGSTGLLGGLLGSPALGVGLKALLS